MQRCGRLGGNGFLGGEQVEVALFAVDGAGGIAICGEAGPETGVVTATGGDVSTGEVRAGSVNQNLVLGSTSLGGNAISGIAFGGDL